MRNEPSENANNRVSLRPVATADLAELYRFQSDPESNRVGGTKPRTRESFEAAWARNFADPGVTARVIMKDGKLVGSVACFKADGLDAVGYTIGREHWGQGIATRALALLLDEVPRRPLNATAALANTRSIRVLERCGFKLTGTRMGEETDRYIGCEVATFVLD